MVGHKQERVGETLGHREPSLASERTSKCIVAHIILQLRHLLINNSQTYFSKPDCFTGINPVQSDLMPSNENTNWLYYIIIIPDVTFCCLVSVFCTVGKSKENFQALRHETCFTQSQNRQEVLRWVLCSCISVCVLVQAHGCACVKWSLLSVSASVNRLQCDGGQQLTAPSVHFSQHTVPKASPLFSCSFPACLTDSRRVSAFTCTVMTVTIPLTLRFT